MGIFDNNKDAGFPPLSWEDDDLPTRPMPLHELPVGAQVDHEMGLIAERHPRIAQGIQKFWGHRDCVAYLQALIVQGYDGEQRTRVGFKPEVSDALIKLAGLHRREFPELG